MFQFKIHRYDDPQFNAVKYIIRLNQPVAYFKIGNDTALVDHPELASALTVKTEYWDETVGVAISNEFLHQAYPMEGAIIHLIVDHFQTAVEKELPLSVAHQLTADLRKQLTAEYYSHKLSVGDIKAGTIAAVTNTAPSYANKAKSLAKMFPSLDTFRADCPECPIGNERLYDLIIHINDRHEWTREQIADFLDTLDVDLSIPLQQHVGSDDKFSPPTNVGSEKEE